MKNGCVYSIPLSLSFSLSPYFPLFFSPFPYQSYFLFCTFFPSHLSFHCHLPATLSSSAHPFLFKLRFPFLSNFPSPYTLGSLYSSFPLPKQSLYLHSPPLSVSLPFSFPDLPIGCLHLPLTSTSVIVFIFSILPFPFSPISSLSFPPFSSHPIISLPQAHPLPLVSRPCLARTPNLVWRSFVQHERLLLPCLPLGHRLLMTSLGLSGLRKANGCSTES